MYKWKTRNFRNEQNNLLLELAELFGGFNQALTNELVVTLQECQFC